MLFLRINIKLLNKQLSKNFSVDVSKNVCMKYPHDTCIKEELNYKHCLEKSLSYKKPEEEFFYIESCLDKKNLFKICFEKLKKSYPNITPSCEIEESAQIFSEIVCMIFIN